jgi:heme/copper-type cytochrome/quinol oxidase subunit 2
MCCVFEILISLFFVYFLIGMIFCGIAIYSAPKEFENKVRSQKVIEVLTFLWPILIVSFFKDMIKNKKKGK